MSADFAHTANAQTNRRGKAELLAGFMTSTRIQRPPKTERERRDLERAAGVNRASDETWAIAIQLWTDRE